MRAPEMGSESGPVTRPRMMSVDCWANAGRGKRAHPAAARRAKRRILTVERTNLARKSCRTSIRAASNLCAWRPRQVLTGTHASATWPRFCSRVQVVRCSTDMASYRQRRNAVNAVTLVGGKTPGVRIRLQVVEESPAFRQCVDALDVIPRIRGVQLLQLHSTVFLRAFSQRSDFDRGPAW